MRINNGFTLIELILVIVLLGILAAVAVPKFLSLAKDAKVEVLTQINVSVKAANDFMFLRSKLPSYKPRPVANRNDLIDVDTNGDGNYDTRLKWSFLDNTDIEKWIELSDEFAIEYQGIHLTFIGYDVDKDNQVRDDNCYFKYTQASSETTPPIYEQVDTGC